MRVLEIARKAPHFKLAIRNVGTDEKRVLAAITNGTEEMEFITIANTLVRSGAKVTIGAVGPRQIYGKCGISIVADRCIEDCVGKEWDMVVCAGGEIGADGLHRSDELNKILSDQHAKAKYIAGICAAPPIVLAPLKILDDHKATCYPNDIYAKSIKHFVADKVVVDKHVITSQGPGTSLAFSLKLVELLFGKEKADEVATRMIA